MMFNGLLEDREPAIETQTGEPDRWMKMEVMWNARKKGRCQQYLMLLSDPVT